MSLPSGYTRLKFIETSGVQHVDTGFKPNQNTRVVMDFEFTGSNPTNALFGGRDNNTVASFTLWSINGQFRSDYNADQRTVSISPSGRLTIDKNKNVTKIGNVSETQPSATFQSSVNLLLFAVQSAASGIDTRKISGRLYSCQIYDNGTLIRDFIPVKSSSGEVGLYDECNSKFYGNDGTGEFSAPVYDLTVEIPDEILTGDVLNCPYGGKAISVTLPKGKYKLEVWGAQGGYRSSSTYGGKGGYSAGTITLDVPTKVWIYTGGSGNSVTTSSSSIYPGGFNGGGYRYGYKGGGGASDIRIGSSSLYARVIVAGGGGSDGASSKQGMYGGGTSGGSSTQSYGSYGYGGAQTGHTTPVTKPSNQPTTNSSSNYPGGFGFGGFGIYRSSGYGGAGGGGWYGGCGVYPDSSGDDDRGGGGGSGYVYTSGSAANYPSGCLLNSKYYLTDTQLVGGNQSFTDYNGSTVTGHSGNGYSRITAIEVSSVEPPTNLQQDVTNREVTLSWNPPAEGTDPEGYVIYQNGVQIGKTSGLFFTSSVSPNQTYTFSVASYAGSSESDQVSISVYYELPDPPMNLSCSIVNGDAVLSWDEPVSSVYGYKIYKDDVYMGTTPQILPAFEFPFSNESLTAPLLMFANGETTSFSYPVEPLTNYTFGVSSYAKEGESEIVYISIYYETYLEISSVSLIPNPALTGSPVSVSVRVEENVNLTIT